MSCKKALKKNEHGMELVREARLAPDKYFIYRSLLHSQRGRVLALQGRFLDAFRELDRAAAGLDGRTGAGRYALAIRSLHLAEALCKHCNHTIDEGKDKADSTQTLTRRSAAHYLERARRSLDDAEELLASGRRDIEAWCLLHRLRARVHLEGMLMALTFGPKTTDRTAISHYGFDESDGAKTSSLRFDAKFLDQARSSLRAIRDTRDNLLKRQNVPWDQDKRMNDLRRLWFDILLACACNAWIRGPLKGTKFVDGFWTAWGILKESVGGPAFVVDLWTFWEKLTRSAGLGIFKDKEKISQECTDRLKELIKQMQDDNIQFYSYLTRKFVQEMSRKEPPSILRIEDLGIEQETASEANPPGMLQGSKGDGTWQEPAPRGDLLTVGQSQGLRDKIKGATEATAAAPSTLLHV